MPLKEKLQNAHGFQEKTNEEDRCHLGKKGDTPIENERVLRESKQGGKEEKRQLTHTHVGHSVSYEKKKHINNNIKY